MKIAIELSMNEDANVKQILNKYGWEPKQWGGPITGGYEGYITVSGVKFRAHLFYGYSTCNLTLQSDDQKSKKLLSKTELAPYLDRAKIKEITSVELSGNQIEQALQKLRAHGWTGEPEYGTAFDAKSPVHELPTFNIQGQEFRAQGLGPMTRDELTLTLYSVAGKTLAQKAVKNSDLAEILSMPKEREENIGSMHDNVGDDVIS